MPFPPEAGARTIRVRLESIDRESSRFALVTSYSFGDRRDEAVLLLSGGRWVVRANSRELVDLVLGVPLSGPQLQSVLTGCPVITGGDFNFERFDDRTGKMIAKSGDAEIEVFIQRDGIVSPWSVLAMTGRVPGRPIRWRADPGRRSHGVLESVRLTSVEGNARFARRFDLTASFDRVQTPAAAGADLLSFEIPESAEAIAIERVRSDVSIPLVAD